MLGPHILSLTLNSSQVIDIQSKPCDKMEWIVYCVEMIK